MKVRRRIRHGFAYADTMYIITEDGILWRLEPDNKWVEIVGPPDVEVDECNHPYRARGE